MVHHYNLIPPFKNHRCLLVCLQFHISLPIISISTDFYTECSLKLEHFVVGFHDSSVDAATNDATVSAATNPSVHLHNTSRVSLPQFYSMQPHMTGSSALYRAFDQAFPNNHVPWKQMIKSEESSNASGNSTSLEILAVNRRYDDNVEHTFIPSNSIVSVSGAVLSKKRSSVFRRSSFSSFGQKSAGSLLCHLSPHSVWGLTTDAGGLGKKKCSSSMYKRNVFFSLVMQPMQQDAT